MNSVALEIEFESAQDLAESELFAFFARRSDAELIDLDPTDPFLRAAGMDIMPYPVTPIDEDQEESERWHANQIGFRRKITVIFRFRGIATLEEREAAWVTMLHAVIAFCRQYPAEAVLLFNREEVIMRCHSGEVIFDTSEYFEEDPNLVAIVAQHRQEKLGQPLM